MAQLVKIESNVTMRNPDKLMHFLKNSLHTLPQLFPETYKSVQVLGAGGRTSSQLATGSVISLIYYPPGKPSGSSSLLRGEVEVVAMDEARKWIALNVIGGDGLKTYKSFRTKCEVVGKSGVVKWSVEYEKATQSAPPADAYLDFYIKLSNIVDT